MINWTNIIVIFFVESIISAAQNILSNKQLLAKSKN